MEKQEKSLTELQAICPFVVELRKLISIWADHIDAVNIEWRQYPLVQVDLRFRQAVR